MVVKRMFVAATAMVLAGTLAACSQDAKTGTDDPASGAASAAPSSSQPADEPSESASADTEESPAAAADGYDAKQLLAAMKAAVATAKSTHVTMTMGGSGQQMTGEGDVSYAGNSTAMRMTMQIPQQGAGTVEVRLVDGVMYLAMPPMTPKGKFVALDTNDPNSPLGDLNGITSGDPLRSFAAFEAGLKKVKYVGEETVDGEDMDHYVLTVDARKAAKAQGTPVPDGAGNVVYDLWLDGDDLMRRVDFSTSGAQMTMEMSDWGKPVSVEAPPRDAIMRIPGS